MSTLLQYLDHIPNVPSDLIDDIYKSIETKPVTIRFRHNSSNYKIFSVNEKLELFLSSWAAHSKKLHCNGTILFGQYLILSVNEDLENASGCSIDSSVRFVKALGQELDIDFFNRMNVLGIESDTTSTQNYFEAANTKKTFLNPLIESLGQLRNDWLLNAQ